VSSLDTTDYVMKTEAVMSLHRAAVILGRQNKGKPKRYSKAEIKRRTERLARARELRWVKKDG
jgi:hypothetical protein